MRAVNLSSGSEGNITYIESNDAKILVDIGLSCKETEKRLMLLGLTGSDIDAILITHEHSDHIKGLDVFAGKFKTKVFAHIDGWDAINRKTNKLQTIQKWAFSSETFFIKDISVSAFKVPHDSSCCVGFCFESNGKKISIATDLGKTTPAILENLFGSQLVYLEANHDIEMLKNNIHYPSSLKTRILSSNGHLSNFATAEAISELVKNGTKQIVLSHLSKENNMPTLAYETICNKLKEKGIIEGENIRIDIASTNPGKIYKIS